MKKVKLFFLFSFFALILGFNCSKVSAFREIGEDGVDITYSFDGYIQIRECGYTITDDGRFNNFYDQVDVDLIYNNPDYDLGYLYNQGYKTLVVEITFNAWKIYDGYQYVYVYADSSTTTYLGGCKFELNTYNSLQPEEITIYMELNISDLLYENRFYIRYDASGKNDDDWKNNNLYVQMGVSKELRKTADFWRLEWDTDETVYYCTKLEHA